MRYLFTYHTDEGKRKAGNQDSLLISRAVHNGKEIVLTVICDGMGGLKNGEVASAEAVRVFAKWFREEFEPLIGEGDFEDALYDAWEKILQKVHYKLFTYGKTHGIRIGTTVTAMLFCGENYYIAHVGDSRIYEIREQAIQLTRDQILAELGENGTGGELSKKEQDVRRSTLLQGVGVSKKIRPAYYSGEIKKDTVYLLCTDGFRHKVSSQELEQAFTPKNLVDEDIMRRKGEYISQIVMERGERDNASVILLRTIEEEGTRKVQEDCYETEKFIVDKEICLVHVTETLQ